VTNTTRVSWVTAEPTVVRRERSTMSAVAPDMVWLEDDPAAGWRGRTPVWPFTRSAPAGLEKFLGGQRFFVVVQYLQAHPMVSPRIFPEDPVPDFAKRSLHSWHLNGDGSLCLLRSASDWDPTATAADLIVKASGWFLECLLLERGALEAMTENGIVDDHAHDGLIS
jgi:hypothetical protein